MEQHAEFMSTGDKPKSLCFSPDSKFLAVGFESGFIRVFDVCNSCVNKSIKSSETPILILK